VVAADAKLATSVCSHTTNRGNNHNSPVTIV
jgi:hypothetical protein